LAKAAGAANKNKHRSPEDIKCFIDISSKSKFLGHDLSSVPKHESKQQASRIPTAGKINWGTEDVERP
jgi:hypothetical protein